MKPLSILVACEHSGIVRQAFRDKGHNAFSCDLLPSDDNSDYHIQCDVRLILDDSWDLMIAHPDCTYLTVSGNKWFSDTAVAKDGTLTGEARRIAQKQALEFVLLLWNSPIPKVVIENPIGRLSTLWQKPSQILQPWSYWDGEPGKGEVKATCLWIRGLPKLVPTTPNETGRHPACWLTPPGPDRWKIRSKTYSGIAKAMADTWS